ncbi:polyprotein [Wild tomato mosaic virus]|uniref:Genome polyprotein n=11 Tax=Wild tomato mosaic virus TaxID=400396 RepID=A6XMW5_9POTV|nr:polyprotein [Wild tomato mosaic virus]ABI34614.1 polyprotein [Wild tomato mosaic virus]
MATTVTFPWSANPEIKQGICRSRGFTLQFGSFEPVAIDWVQEGANILQKYHEAMCDFDEACIDMIRNRSNDRVVKRHGVLKYAPKTPTMLRKERRRARLERERKDFLNAPDQYVTEICFPPEAPKRMETPSIRFPPVVVRKKRVAPQRQSVAISHAGFDNLLRELTVVCREMNKPLEFVGSARGLVRANIVKPSPFESRLVCVTKHHEGIIQSIDVHVPNTVRAIFTRIAQLAWKGPIIHEWDCKIGDSGVCIPKGKLKSPSRTINENLFIVRGAYRNELQDAQQALPLYKYMRMVHFSAGEKFWEGFNKGFLTHRTTPTVHAGSNTIDVVECGFVAAIMCQSLMPCCRITCTVCAKQYVDSDSSEIATRIEHSLADGINEIESKYPSFKHAVKFLKDYRQSLHKSNPNHEASGKVQFLIGERRDQPFMHILNINEVLMRGGRASSEEFARASDDLLELARHHKNRVESLKKGSLHLFRNKVASKAHLNPSLMCDNQLDVNGNFVWGKRGYHAKRFFSNFFELIQPSDGYDKYIVRRNPNGSRKLAIGNLILSTNLESLRKQLEGEPIETLPLTEQCIGKRHESFIHPTCCVTYDDGTPLLSEFKAPTKNHLVLGNSGDSKYLDLPTEISENLYIAQEGYCYVNIFLAMLVEVDEKDAKDFTKWVRDIIVRQLNKWPTMTDVALACYQLSVLFPSTRSAELPRILVDHKTKTMHVIDSFGSLTTGYHILKANTVSQLILFASDTLESEMKLYCVGGSPTDFSTETEGYKRRLFRSVYRPKEFKNLMLEEPIIITLALMSPTLIHEMYWSGGLHRAMQIVNKSDMNIKMVVSTILDMSKKVVKADDLFNQAAIINAYTDSLLEIIKNAPHQSLAKDIVLEFLLVHQSTNEIDGDLSALGFRTLKFRSLHLMEKIYKADLEAQWCELSWLERSYVIYYTFKSRIQCMRDLSQDKSQILKQTFKCSTAFVQDRMKVIPNSVQSVCSKSVCIAKSIRHRVYKRLYRCAVNTFSDAFQFLQTMAIISILLSVFANLIDIKNKYRNSVRISDKEKMDELDKSIFKHYTDLKIKNGVKPSEDEFSEYLKERDPDAFVHWFGKDLKVQHQASKRPSEAKLEQIVAFIALLMMVFDGDRGDCVYKVLNKLRNVMGSVDNEAVNHQSLDTIVENFEETNEMIEFEITAPDAKSLSYKSSTFQTWWDNQITMNNVISHYRTEGRFIEFSRDRAAQVANEISTSDIRDYLIRGAVGSGKSTGLPHHLCKKGKVLLLEPTRPLAENVHSQLSQQPFHHNPTLMMRNKSVFGSTPITIMTSGYALHYLANNSHRLQEFAFIMFDECHVLDASAMAFRSLLADRAYEGKILKVSATPPGRETEFKTQYPVTLKTEETLSFQQFVDAQGTGTNADVTSDADNILVYVSSYNEVDQLSKMLAERHHKVTKVDGRTMKSGATEIKTYGTKTKKHFIVATNIIENGVTIDIDAVVDFGLKINADIDIDCRMIRYAKGSINYGERIQRLGRVGRTKPGVALRIGHTNKGIEGVPTMIANEAAFLCFMYGLPVMTAQVSTSILSQCTVQQARTMALFELPIYFMMDFVASDGTMHPAIHALLKKYKLRESEILLTKLAIPHAAVHKWMSVREYNQCTRQLEMDPDIKLSFHVKDVPEELYEKLWQCVLNHKGDAGFKRISSHNAARIAHKLRTDDMAIQRTICYIDQLIASEMQKKEHFDSLVNAGTSSLSFTLQSVSNMIRSRYAKDYSVQNLSILHAARAQLVEFSNLHNEYINDGVPELHLMRDNVMDCGALETVMHQSKQDISKFLKLKGVWNGALLTRDVLIAAGVACGGAWMMYQYLMDSFSDNVDHQAQNKSKRQRQKLKFRDARDSKVGRVVVDDDSGAVEHFFGSAYSKKNKSKGKMHGMGKKNRRFVNMYGFDPTEYSFIRFVDPLTGEMLDESVMADIMLVQEHFNDLRHEYLSDDKIQAQALYSAPGLTAYFVKDKVPPVLKVDLTAHVPLKVCDNSSTIAGYPEHENVLRQTGQGKLIDPNELPKSESVEHEAHSLHRGLRDYNNISKIVCKIENNSDAVSTAIHGVGFGSVIISNRHLFKRNNGELKVKSTHGDFKVVNTKELKIHPIDKYDIVLIRLPKDFPPFPTKAKFRKPTLTDSICLIGTNFQEKFLSSLVSSFSSTGPVENSNFWRHWIDTKDGHCGLPLVAQEDGAIVGFHSLTSTSSDKNYFAAVPENMHEILKSVESLEWRKGWLYNPNEIGWGSLKLTSDTPNGMFKVSKLVEDLHSTFVQEQSGEAWLYPQLTGNLKAVGRCESQLVTKHVVKGPCQLFQLYLQTDSEAKDFFKPLMGFYGKSRLNRTAYAKDILKYSTEIEVGKVDTDLFERAIRDVIADLHAVQFNECEYVTDEEAIFQSLNMKSAVGALYKGKKREYFETYSSEDKRRILEESCLRLYTGRLGVWNGSIKAELRPMEKVQANKTRTFTAAPIDTLLAGKVCVDDFNNQFYSKHTEALWSVGISKFSGGWDKLLRKLPDGWVYCSADGSRFDSSLTPYLINAVLHIRLHFMEKWSIGEQMLRNLYAEIIYTPILTADGTVVKKFKGNNSGQPSTVVDNTLMVLLAMRYSLQRLGLNYKEQCKECVFFANGDDLIVAVKPHNTWILDNLSDIFSELGLSYDFSERTKDRSELWFMSHQGKLIDDMYIPKLEEQRIVSILEWDRAEQPEHRLEAICAAMIEAWGHPELLHQIRRFYKWILEQAPYSTLAEVGKAPYISETALRNLYMNQTNGASIDAYIRSLIEAGRLNEHSSDDLDVRHQSGETVDAGKNTGLVKDPTPNKDKQVMQSQPPTKDKDVNVGTTGTFSIPRLKGISSKLTLPKTSAGMVVNLEHLLEYKPDQIHLSNARALNSQFQSWYDGVKNDYDVDDEQMKIIMNGLMVWCIENGTSPNINGMWVMIDGEEQVEYPIKPLIDHAKPSFRQIMAHFSNLAEAYIERRNSEKPYMPRYGLQRNLTDMSLARYAFDFYEMTSKTPSRAREAHIQMKAAALRNANNRMFGLDGKVGTQEEDTERHTAEDVNRNMHNLLGVRGV